MTVSWNDRDPSSAHIMQVTQIRIAEVRREANNNKFKLQNIFKISQLFLNLEPIYLTLKLPPQLTFPASLI